MRIIRLLINYYKRRKLTRSKQQEWRSMNLHNFTVLGDVNCPIDVVTVKKGTYGPINVRWFWDKNEHISIGSFCSIAEGVTFLTGGNHNMKTLSSYPFDHYYKNGYQYRAPTKGPIIVEDDVWIGMNSMILSGVRIGQGAVIGANSVVAKDVPPYAIYVGNKVVKYRFSEDVISRLIKFDYSKLSEADIKQNHDILTNDIDEAFFDTDFYKNHLKDNI